MATEVPPTGTFTTRYEPARDAVLLAALATGAAVKAEPFEDMWTVRWWRT